MSAKNNMKDDWNHALFCNRFDMRIGRELQKNTTSIWRVTHLQQRSKTKGFKIRKLRETLNCTRSISKYAPYWGFLNFFWGGGSWLNVRLLQDKTDTHTHTQQCTNLKGGGSEGVCRGEGKEQTESLCFLRPGGETQIWFNTQHQQNIIYLSKRKHHSFGSTM